MPQASTARWNLVKTGEGFRASPAQLSPAGAAAIGYGHLVHRGPVCGAASEAPFAGGISETPIQIILTRHRASRRSRLYSENALEAAYSSREIVGGI